VNDTIPGLLLRAADRDPDGIWLRTDEGQLSFAGAAGEVARVTERFADAGVAAGDLVVLTARGTPPYLLCWLALTSMGAVAVATNPASTEAELAGLIGQVRPRLVVTDAESDDRGVRRRARRPGHADPDVWDDRPVQARDADPPGLRVGG
jgi:acyl-CoA synthetase (AMP-forming)/AMP-acid ligase II